MAQSEEFIFPGWEVTRKLGEGSFGGVYEIRRTLPGGRVEKCALKKLTIPKDNGEIEELYSHSFGADSITAHYKNRMEELVKALEKFAEKTDSSRTEYDKCENSVAGIVSSIRV